MARQNESDEITALMTGTLDELEASLSAFDRTQAEQYLLPSITAIVRWVRAREDDDLEVDLSNVVVEGEALSGTGTIT